MRFFNLCLTRKIPSLHCIKKIHIGWAKIKETNDIKNDFAINHADTIQKSNKFWTRWTLTIARSVGREMFLQ